MEKRRKKITLRLREDEYRLVEEKARQAGQKVAEFCRNITLCGDVIVKQNRRIELDETAMINLYRVGGNLNQLVKHLNTAKGQYMTYEEVLNALSCIVEIREIYKKILEKLK